MRRKFFFFCYSYYKMIYFYMCHRSICDVYRYLLGNSSDIGTLSKILINVQKSTWPAVIVNAYDVTAYFTYL